MKIHLLAEDDRPMEKLLAKGPAALSNSELTALVLRGGLKDKNAIELARELMGSAGGTLTGLSAMSIQEMMKIGGIGRMKASALAAAIELGRRFASEAPNCRRRAINTAKDVYRILGPSMKGLKHEECRVIFLSRRGTVAGIETMSSGGLDSTVIDRRMVVAKALEYKALSIVLVHNHPSGDPTPGSRDISETVALKASLETFCIGLLDHIIISDTCYYSFADEMVYEV